MTEVRHAEIVRGLGSLRLDPPLVAAHCSLRSFGQVAGGAPAVIAALQGSFETVMIPGFQYAASVPPPMPHPPQRNGCDYRVHFDWVNPPKPYRVAEVPIRPSIGLVGRAFAEQPGVHRSVHPWHSWSAWGRHAEELVRDHTWTAANLPLERLAALGGWVVLIGATLASCTAIHSAEERAGRAAFIRWAMDDTGAIREVRANSCGKGFVRLAPLCEAWFRTARIGEAQVMAAPLTKLIEQLAPVIRARPDCTICSPACLRCNDSAAGGPVEPRA
jgi:aminoglycoside 3-N-acetyltransferase